jgi:kynureninase
MDELLRWRHEFPILEKTVYMVSHSLGAMSRRSRDYLQEYADVWATRGIRAWGEGWWTMPVTAADLVGKIIGAGSRETVILPNVSICHSVVMSCFDWSGRRNKLVCSALDFPSNLYLYNAFERRGARVVTVASDDGITVPLERMLDAIDEETLLVCVSHVIFRSAFIQDLNAITERAHKVGALVIADLYQSAGTVPLNVREINVDVAAAGSVKWLCAGPGTAYLYVRPDHWSRLEPQLTGWMAHKEPFAFQAGPIEYADDITRFLNGTPNIPGIYAARGGLEIIAEIGVEKIRQKSIKQTARLIELAEEAGFGINSPRNADERGGSVIIDVPNGHAVSKELLRRDFLVDYRPGAGIRIGPHFYSTDEELDLIISEIKTILQTRAYEKHSAARAGVTPS